MLTNSGVSMLRESLAAQLKLILQVVLLLLLVTGLLSWLVMNNQAIAFPVLEWAGIAALGVIAGLMARWRLRTHTQALKFLAAVVALAVNLWILGLLTTGSLGFSAAAASASGVNWHGLGQLGLGALLVWISLAAKRGSVQVNKPENRQKKESSQAAIQKEKSRQPDKKGGGKAQKPKSGHTPKKTSASPQSATGLFAAIKVRAGRLQQYLQPVRQATKRAHQQGLKRLKSRLTRLKTGPQQASSTIQARIAGKTPEPVVHVGRPPLKVQPAVTGSKSGEIRLRGEIEHRCPFCLEIVEKNSPRGVRICKICKTYHHADCWEVTGTCQVPHHYE
jgi:hypothetical protein